SIGSAGGDQVGSHGLVEVRRSSAEIDGLARQCRLHVGSDFDAVGRIVVFIQQLQCQQAVHDLCVLDVGHAGQLQGSDDRRTSCAAQSHTAHAETDCVAFLAGEFAL